MMLYSKKKIKKALKQDVIKWANVCTGHKEVKQDCSLCDMFLFLNDCRMCPIMDKTGFAYCVGTPFDDWKKHQKDAHGINVNNGVVAKCDECVKLAKRQYSFVSSILHKEGVKTK